MVLYHDVLNQNYVYILNILLIDILCIFYVNHSINSILLHKINHFTYIQTININPYYLLHVLLSLILLYFNVLILLNILFIYMFFVNQLNFEMQKILSLMHIFNHFIYLLLSIHVHMHQNLILPLLHMFILISIIITIIIYLYDDLINCDNDNSNNSGCVNGYDKNRKNY